MIATRSLRGWVPGVEQFRAYQRGWLRGDVIAGFTVTAYLVPQVMAYSTLAGLPAVTGLWAAIVASDRVCPVRLLATAVGGAGIDDRVDDGCRARAPSASATGALRHALAATLAVLVGAVCFVGALVAVGVPGQHAVRPVLVGYMTGVAILMIASQLGKITGVTGIGRRVRRLLMRSFARGYRPMQWPTMVLSASVLLLLLGLGRACRECRGPLIAVLAATAVVVVVLSLRRTGH